MKRLFTAAATILLCCACSKQVPDTEISNYSLMHEETAAILDEGFAAPPYYVKAYLTEAPPSRSYQLVEFINTQRAYHNLTLIGSRSYYYTQRQTNVVTDNTGGATTTIASTIVVDFETGYLLPALDIAAMVRCFYAVSDVNAVCTIEILTDIPVDGNPSAYFNWLTNSPGHCFLRMRKTSGGKTVSRYIGFYPESALKAAATTAAIPGKFVENTGHEYNASMRMQVSAADFRKALGLIQLTAKAVSYDVDDYNCTDFALSIFNSLRPNDPVSPARQRIPNTITTRGSLTPQGLYQELLRRKNTIPADKFYIRNSTGKLYAPAAENPCS